MTNADIRFVIALRLVDAARILQTARRRTGLTQRSWPEVRNAAAGHLEDRRG